MKRRPSNFFVIDEAGAIHDLPECENCGATIYRVGLCAVCASVAEEVQVITHVSEVIEPPDLWD